MFQTMKHSLALSIQTPSSVIYSEQNGIAHFSTYEKGRKVAFTYCISSIIVQCCRIYSPAMISYYSYKLGKHWTDE